MPLGTSPGIETPTISSPEPPCVSDQDGVVGMSEMFTCHGDVDRYNPDMAALTDVNKCF